MGLRLDKIARRLRRPSSAVVTGLASTSARPPRNSSTLEARIVRALGDADAPIGKTALADRVTGKRSSVLKAIDALVAGGYVAVEGEGRKARFTLGQPFPTDGTNGNGNEVAAAAVTVPGDEREQEGTDDEFDEASRADLVAAVEYWRGATVALLATNARLLREIEELRNPLPVSPEAARATFEEIARIARASRPPVQTMPVYGQTVPMHIAIRNGG